MMSIEKNILFDVSKKYGLPVYVYDKNKIISQYSKLRNAFINIDNLHINYAAKALSNINILNIMKDVGCGIDAVSIQEVELALYVGFKTDQIFYTPSGVELSEIKKALKLGVQINIDNISALKKIAENLIQKHSDRILFKNLKFSQLKNLKLKDENIKGIVFDLGYSFSQMSFVRTRV